jgi:hypothetical protein
MSASLFPRFLKAALGELLVIVVKSPFKKLPSVSKNPTTLNPVPAGPVIPVTPVAPLGPVAPRPVEPVAPLIP